MSQILITNGSAANILWNFPNASSIDIGKSGTVQFKSWGSTMETLMLLSELGLDPASPQARKAIGMVRDPSRLDFVVFRLRRPRHGLPISDQNNTFKYKAIH